MSKKSEPPNHQFSLIEYLPIMLCGLTIPVSIMMWLGNVVFVSITQSPNDDGNLIIHSIYNFINYSFHRKSHDSAHSLAIFRTRPSYPNDLRTASQRSKCQRSSLRSLVRHHSVDCQSHLPCLSVHLLYFLIESDEIPCGEKGEH